MKLAAGLLLSMVPCTPAPPGKSTIASAHPMEGMEFLLKYLPVAVAEDNGTGNYGHGAVQGRTQTIPDTSYSAPNCQLYSKAGSKTQAAASQSMTSNGIGSACTYSASKTYGSANQMWKVYANNKVQCCNACVSTTGCAAATFETSTKDHTGGFGPQSWEGFGIHMPNVEAAKTAGGLAVDELISKYEARFGDFSKFDAFMDYSATFYTYDLQHYIDAFKTDSVKHFVGQWVDGQKRTWYSMIFQVPKNTYVIELVSQNKPSGAASMPEMEQRMSDAHCTKFVAYKDTQAKYLEIASINRAASDMKTIDDVHTNLFKARTTLKIDGAVTKRCYSYSSSEDALTSPPGPGMSLDEDVCFTGRASEAEQDAIFSVANHEEALWGTHAAQLGNNPSSFTDKYTDSHYGLPLPQAGLTALAAYFKTNNPYPITKQTRLAYACEQNYIIDPTGLCIQPLGQASWPGCGFEDVAV